MARMAARPEPAITKHLRPQRVNCAHSGGRMRADYTNRRTVATLAGLTRLHLLIRRCHAAGCEAFRRPYRPEAEGRLALSHHEFGLDVIAGVGRLRYAEHRCVPEIRTHLAGRGVAASERTVTNLLDRYDELLAVARRLAKLLAGQGRVILAIDGLQPDVGHEVLWVVRDVLSGEVLLAKSLLSARRADLAELFARVRDACPVPIAGVVSDGQHSIRWAVARSLPGVPYQLCQFHYLREAARPIFEADRHAKKLLKQRVRQVRPLERAVEGRADPAAAVIRGYCGAVRSALTDDGRQRELRDLTRQRSQLGAEQTAVANRIQKVLEDANVKLGSVASDVLGVSGRAMLDALVAGQEDPEALADLARRRMRGKIPQLREALRGRVTDPHRFLLRLPLDHYDQLGGLIARLDARIEERTAPDAEALALLTTIPGIKPHTAEVLPPEVGPTVDPFPTAGQFASWAGMCPGNNESAGKRRTGRTTKGNRWLRQAVVQAGWAASRSKKTYLGARYRRVARRRGAKRALMAVGHTLLVIVYQVLRKREAYRELGADYYDRLQPERLTRHLVHRLEQLGHTVTLDHRAVEEPQAQPE